MLTNVRGKSTIAANCVTMCLVPLIASAGPAFSYRMMVQHVQVCRPSCQPCGLMCVSVRVYKHACAVHLVWCQLKLSR